MHHHYVPVFYLKFWVDGRDGKVPYFTRHAGKLVQGRIAPRSTGYEPGLYALDKVSNDRRDDIEKKFFSPLDSAAALIHKRLEARERFVFSFDDRLTWARFLLAANLRVPEKIQHAKELGTSTLRAVLQEDPEEFLRAKGSTPEATLTEWVLNKQPGLLENIGLANLVNLLSKLEYLRPIMDLEWTVHPLPKTGQKFLTCDRPFFSFGAPTHERFTIVLPLSPRSLFVASKTRAVADRMADAGPRKLANRVNSELVQKAVLRVYGKAQYNFVDSRLRFSWPPRKDQDQDASPSA